MSVISTPSLVQTDTQTIDDCWNRIGIAGDKSCPLLVEHIRCRNCGTYAAAATRLLDRYVLPQELEQVTVQIEERRVTGSLLIFRLGEEWVALATRCLLEVSPLRPVHALPHQRSKILLGVVNVRGELVACLSLVELLGIDSTPQASAATRVVPRMLIIAAQGGPVVVPVDEVAGIHSIDESALSAAPPLATQAEARHTRGVLHWRGRTLRWLDEESLLSAMIRSLT